MRVGLEPHIRSCKINIKDTWGNGKLLLKISTYRLLSYVDMPSVMIIATSFAQGLLPEDGLFTSSRSMTLMPPEVFVFPPL